MHFHFSVKGRKKSKGKGQRKKERGGRRKGRGDGEGGKERGGEETGRDCQGGKGPKYFSQIYATEKGQKEREGTGLTFCILLLEILDPPLCDAHLFVFMFADI